MIVIKKINYSARTDFADEKIVATNVSENYRLENRVYRGIKIAEIEIFKTDSIVQKEPGTYVSIEFDDITSKLTKKKVSKVLINAIKGLMKKNKIPKRPKILLVGLGNRSVTADSLGPMVAERILVTNHLFEHAPELLQKGAVPVSVLSPGVMGQTGLETSDIVASVAKNYQPDLVIAVDALASKSITRINRVIQITDTGINPGSGIGNHRKAFNYQAFKVPVLAIGVATVVEAAAIVEETMEELMDRYNLSLSEDRKKMANKKSEFIRQILEESGVNMVVTPKEIDEEARNLSIVISDAINFALHDQFQEM